MEKAALTMSKREYLRYLAFKEADKIVRSNKKTSGIEAAMEDVRMGRVYPAKNAKDLMQQTAS
jgi:hypothetical protein